MCLSVNMANSIEMEKEPRRNTLSKDVHCNGFTWYHTDFDR